MAYTMQQVCDLAGIPLNDDDKVRAPDATSRLPFAKSALLMLVSKRPDLFYGQYSAMPDMTALVLASTFPVDDTLAQAVADYITARVEAGNDESVLEARAAAFFDLFRGQL